MPIAADNLPDDPAALKRIITGQLEFQPGDLGLGCQRILRHCGNYRRAEFGRSSEKLARDTEQLKLALEAPQTDQAERLATASPAVAAAVETAAEALFRL